MKSSCGVGSDAEGAAMSYRVILVPILHDEADKAALAVTRTLIDAGRTHVVGLHVRVAPGNLVAGGDGSYMPVAILESLEEQDRERASAARNLFSQWRQACGLELSSSPQQAGASSADWHEVLCPVGVEIGRRGRAADLIVLARSPRGYSVATDGALEGALFTTGRPVVIVPEEPARPPSTVVIAWNDSREAARAVASSWPLLARAERIVVFVGGDDEAMRRSADRLTDHLLWRGYVRPTLIVDPARDVAVSLLDVARREQAGLIVMGAYSHSRLQQYVLGGATTDMFRLCRIPLLLAH